MAYSKQATIGSVARIAARDVDIDDDILKQSGATAYLSQSAHEALRTLDSASDNQIANGRVFHDLEESHTVVISIIADGDLVTLTVEDALIAELTGTLVSRVLCTANHYILLSELREVDVGRQTGIHLLHAFVHHGGKPVQIGSRSQRIVAVNRLEIVTIHFAAVLANAINELMGVTV